MLKGFADLPCQRGGSTLETVLVLILVAVLILIALDRFTAVRVEAERTAMEQVLEALQSAVRERLLSLNIHGDSAELGRLEGANPMIWLSQSPQKLLGRSWPSHPPRNYLGERADPDPATIPGGQWYFNTRERMLIYRVENAPWFETRLPGPARARFKLTVTAADTGRSGQDNALPALSLRAVEPYRWRKRPVEVERLLGWWDILRPQ